MALKGWFSSNAVLQGNCIKLPDSSGLTRNDEYQSPHSQVSAPEGIGGNLVLIRASGRSGMIALCGNIAILDSS